LASLLEQQSTVNGQLTNQLEDLKQQNSRLQQMLESERKTFDEKHKRELGALKEQLQVHIQTIGILVAEKTELQSSLNQNQKAAESRQAEIEELSGRLKASRQRVADLERNFSTASNSSQKNEKSNKELSKEVEKLKLDLYKLNKSNEEFQQHNLELQGKLQKKLAEVAKLEDETIEMRGQLQMSELHIKQLQNSSETPSEGAMKQIEELLAARSELQNKLQLTEDAMRNCQMDRDSTIQQYTLFIDQLQQQSRQLQTQVESLMDERDQLASRARELESVVAQLKAKDVASTEMTVQNLEEKAELAEKIERLKSELMAVSKNLEVQSADNSQLSRLIIEKEQRIVELEMTVERATDTAVDKEKLLEIMQGDKTALSRAMAQNKELKNQLAELQNTFVKMSTDNMEMLTRLQSEQHVAKELASRLGQQEDELKEMRELLMHKEHELGDLHKRDAERACEHRHELSSEEMEQRMRHFSEQVPLIESLQRELSSAQDAINALTVQNSNLRSVLEQNASGGGATDGTSGSVAQVV
jgi:chromosome segregation ATPase